MMTSGALVVDNRELQLRRLTDTDNLAILYGLAADLDRVAGQLPNKIIARRGLDFMHIGLGRSRARMGYQAGAAASISIDVQIPERFGLTHSASSSWLAFISRMMRISANRFKAVEFGG